MKKIFTILISAAIIVSITLSAGAALLSPGLLVLSEADPMVMSGLVGEPVAFTAKDFSLHTGFDAYDKIRITSLPDSEEGTLSVAGEAISENDSISYKNIDRLVFSPAEGVTESAFSFSIGEGYEAKCVVKLSEKSNYAPTASSALTAIDTFSGMSVSGHMVASDPEGDELTYEITEYPKKGELSYNKSTGSFSYKSASTGKDSFTFIVKDNFGNYSDKATVDFSVSSNTTGISFKDMKENGAYAAAIHMIDDGIMSASESDGNVYFEPAATVSRLDFLVSAMNVLGAGNLPTVSGTGFADDEDIPVDAKSYVYSAYKLGIINGSENADGERFFHPAAAITRAEAAVILNNIVGYSATAEFDFEDSVATWASDSVFSMYELGVLTTDDGCINASAPLTRDESALLLHGLNKLVS